MPDGQETLVRIPPRRFCWRAIADDLAPRAEVNPSTITSPALSRADTNHVGAFAFQAATLAMPGALSQ
jgi:hypothetical protein